MKEPKITLAEYASSAEYLAWIESAHRDWVARCTEEDHEEGSRMNPKPPMRLRELIVRLQDYDPDLYVAISSANEIHERELCDVEIVGKDEPIASDGPVFLVLREGGVCSYDY